MSAITQIETTRATLYAFAIDGEVSGGDMTRMAERMNAAFDTHDNVDMLLIFRNYQGAEDWATFSWESIKSRVASLANVRRYYVVGAPKQAADMIEGMGKIIPVEAQTFPIEDEDAAWAALDARPTDAAETTV